MATGGTIGLAFVDIVGDTSRTEQQVERDMSRVVAQVGEAIRPVDITAAVENGTEQDLTRQINADIRAVSAAADAVRVDARLSQDARDRIRAQLRETTAQLRASRSELEIRVAERPIVESTVEAVVEAAHVAEAAAPTIEFETRVDSDRVRKLFTDIDIDATKALSGVASLGKGLLGLAGAAQAGAGILSVLQAIGPAAALAAPAVASVGLAMGTIKLATAGVGDAVKTAFDPSDPKKYAEALKGLSPEARSFVGVLHEMQPALKDLQQQVQDKVFSGFDDELKLLAKNTLPAFKTALLDSANTFNLMGHSVADSANALAANGTLGKALSGANAGLKNLSGIPAEVVTAFGQLAAAAGPAFGKVTSAVAQTVTQLQSELADSFQSGGLEKAINQAVVILGQLGHVLHNVASIVLQVFSAANASGGSFIQTLSKITDQLVVAFASPAVQSGLQALFSTMSILSSTAAPLLGEAFKVIGSTLTALAPGVQVVISALGTGLQPIIQALGPVLKAAAEAVSQLFMAFAPVLPIIGSLIAQLGPILTPILNAVAIAFQQLAPFVSELALMLGSFLTPILQQVPTLIQPLLDAFIQMTQLLFPVAVDLLKQLQPSVAELSTTFTDLAVQLAPVLAQLIQLAIECLKPLMPLLPPIIKLVGDLAKIFADELSTTVQTVVIPALRGLQQFLNGDLDGAFHTFEDVAVNVSKAIVREMILLPIKIVQAFGGLGAKLFDIGTNIIGSLVRGIVNAVPGLRETLNTITSMIPKWKGPESLDRRLLTPAGQAIMAGLVAGIKDGAGDVKSTLNGVTNMIGATSAGGIGLSAFGGTAPLPSPMLPADPNSQQNGGTMVQVFLGTREIEDIIGTQIVANNRARDRVQSNGVRY